MTASLQKQPQNNAQTAVLPNTGSFAEIVSQFQNSQVRIISNSSQNLAGCRLSGTKQLFGQTYLQVQQQMGSPAFIKTSDIRCLTILQPGEYDLSRFIDLSDKIRELIGKKYSFAIPVASQEKGTFVETGKVSALIGIAGTSFLVLECPATNNSYINFLNATDIRSMREV